ncbi:LOW QUALITY PROTEIN: uncharacterized protein EMH_0045130 [Eimeria mitis]|uniref:Uncharacterized protein n=1 Tax=Eimeria mitis TaxID=44415 RepID=U6KGM6_9EIME|nr:LOW QUALITY PROTEIN: uncharacterized protein EMH_0045130 [Eimeria mitis]CDJ35926.1 hypothetical protein EMH_0045130 [Eimeria mitis]
MQQQQQAKQQQQLKQQQQAKQQQQQQPVSLNALDEQADLPATSGSAADFSYVSLGQCMTAAAATAAAATAASKGLYSEVRSVEDAFALLRRQWLLLHAGATTDGKKGSAGSAAAVSYIPVLQLQQQDPLLLHVDSRQQGLLRQAVAAAVPCLCRFLLRCLSPVSLVSMSLESLFTLLAQLAAAESCCSCSKRGGSSKGLQEHAAASSCLHLACPVSLALPDSCLAQAALQNTNTQSRRLDAVQFAGLWGACLGLAASIANASATESQQPATAATAAAVPAAMTTAQAARSAAAAAAHTKEEGDLSNITALLGLLSRGGPEARACFFLLAEALLQQPAVASGACAAAMAAAPPPVGNEDTEQAVLLSPLFCCFLRSSRKTLSLSDPQSAINRLLHVAATTSEATGDPTATQQTPEAAAPITADTGACAATEEPADDTVTAAAATVAAKCLLLELTCAFKALAAFVRQQPEAAAAATATTRTVDADAVSDFVTLVVEASSILCCCRCNSSNNKELSLQSMIVLEEESPEKKQQEQEKPRHQQHVCCRCFCRGSAAPIAAAHAGLEAAALEALSILPHIEIHCRNQQQQQLLLQMGLSAVTIPAKAAALFPAALVACCISPAAVAPAPILRAAPLEKLQQPQILLQQLLLQQQQRGEVDSALFIGCGIAVDSLGGPTIWEAQWRCAADVTTAAFSALRLPALVAARDPAEAAVSAAETGWRADYPPHVLRVLQGGLLLRRLLFSCNICSPAAEAAVQQTAWAACCSWGRQLPPAASLDAPAVRSNRRSSKVEAGKGGAACSSTGVHLRPFGSIKGSRPQQLLQRFGLPRLKKKTICTAPAAPFAAEACFVPERDPSAFPSEDNEISVLQLGIVAAVLSDAFRAQQALLCSATRGHEQQQLSQSVVDTLWCCCEKALAAATPLERLLYADVAGGLYWFLRIADSPQQQPDAAAATGLQAVNKHIEAFLQMPLNAAETEKREVRLQMSSSRLCSVSLLAARLLPLLQRRGSSEVAAADGSSKCCQDLLQLSLAATSSIEAAEQVVAAACDTAAAAAAKDNAAAANVSSSCALLCVIRFLGATFPAVASDAAAAASSTTYATASGGETSKSLADSERPEDPQQLQQQQQNALQQQLFRAMQFLFLLRSSQFHLSRAAVLAADAARHLLECLLQHAAAAAVAGPDALLSATEEFISHAAREASYLLSVSVQRVADCSNSSSSSGIVLQVVAAAPALRCLTALMWIQSSASIAQEAPVPADGEDSTLAAAALSLRALLPAAVAVTEFAVASPSLVVRREAARSLLSMSRPLSETMWGPTIALAAAAAPPEVVTAATAPVAGDPQLAIFLLEALNSECDALQRQLLLQVLQQQVRIWGPRNLMQWVSLLTSLCCGCVPASSPLAQQLCTLRPSSYSNRYGSSAPFLLQRAQQLLPQSPKVLLSPLAAARPLPALTGLVWNPLPGVSAPAVARTQHESCRADTKGSTNDDCNESEVQPVVRSAAAECLELLLTLPELQQQHHSWVAPAADVYQTKQAGSEAATPAGSFLIDCLPLLVRAACELLWQGIRQQQQKQQQQSGLASDGGISLSPRGLRILLLLLERLTGDSSEPRDGSQELPVQQLQQYEVGVSSAVSGLLRCCAKASAPELLELPETAGAVAAAIATAFVAAEGEMAMALRRAAFLRLRAAAAGGDAIDEENHQQQLLQAQEPQQQQLTDMALEVMLRFAEAGCCLSPWRLVGQLLLPLGDVVQSAAALVAEAIAATPEVSQSDWLLHRRLLLACRLVAHVVAAAAPTTGAPPSTPTAAVNVFVEQREQWVAAIEPCAVPLALHLMGRLLKLSRQREQQELQQCQKQQQQEEHQLLKGLALLCRPLSTESGDRQAAAASAFAALAAASRSNSTGGTAAAGEAAAATATGAALLEAFCHLLNGLSDALLRPVETAAAACESCPADADWSETAVDGVCWRLELIGILLPSLCFPLNPQQQQRKQLPQQQQQHQLDEEDWTEDWLGADSPTSSSGAQAPVVAPADASAPVVPAEGSADVGCLYHVVLRRTCEAAGRLAGAAAEVAAAEAAAAAKLEVHDYSGEAPATASLPQQGMTPFDGVEEAQAAADASASTVDFASVPLTGGAAGRVVYCCINFLWGVSATLQQNPEVLGEEASAFAFFGAIRDVSGAALWLPVDAARPAAKAAEDDRPSGPLCEAALSLLQRGFSVVAMMPPGTAAASAFTLLLSPLEVPVFPSRLCYGTANCVSPLEAMRLLRSLYQAAARAAGAAAAAPAAVTTTEDAAAAARLASTGLQGHFAGLIESAVSAFTGTAADLEKELPKAATAAAPAVSPAASGDTGGVLALAAALVAIDALSVTKGPSSSIGVNEQLQQQQQPEWCVRIKAALQRLSEFAYAVDASGDRVALAASAEKRMDSEAATGSLDSSATAKERPPTAAGIKRNVSGNSAANGNGAGAADATVVLEKGTTSDTAITAAQGETGTEAAGGFPLLWPTHRQHAAAQLRGFLLRVARQQLSPV